jgi:hypothetical protein
MDTGFPLISYVTPVSTAQAAPAEPKSRYDPPSRRESLLQILGNSDVARNYFEDDAIAERFFLLAQAFGAKKRTAVRELFNEYSSLFDKRGKRKSDDSEFRKSVRAFVDRRAMDGCRPLRKAIEAAENGLVIWLLENGAQPSANVLTVAIDSKIDEQTFRALLTYANRRGVNLVNAFDGQGFTPLSLAAHKGDLDRVNLLLACCPKLDVNQSDKRGNTPLMLAAATGNYGVVYRLLAGHADVTRKSSGGHSSLVMTLQCWDDANRVYFSLTLEAQLEVLKGMLAEGGNVEQRARAILEAAYKEADDHGQAERSRIALILGKE